VSNGLVLKYLLVAALALLLAQAATPEPAAERAAGVRLREDYRDAKRDCAESGAEGRNICFESARDRRTTPPDVP
jgi:hypothetical protein